VLQVPDSGAGISWTIGGGPVGNVELKYCTDYTTDKTWVTIPGADNLSSGSSPFAWDVDLNIGPYVGIRIEEKNNPTLIKNESGPYEVKGTINVSTPTLNETLRVGGDRLIEWTHKGDIGNVSIAFSTGAGYVDIYTGIPVTALNKNWVGIPDERSETCKVKVYLASEPNPDTGTAGESPLFRIRGDISDAATDLLAYNLGDDCVITWTSNPAGWGDNVNVMYTIDNGETYSDPIDTVLASAGTYTWENIPDEDLLYEAVKIKVEHASFSDTSDITPGFAIRGSINIPSDAEIDDPANIPAPGYWEMGDTRPIEWDVTGVVGDVNLYYKYGGGAWQQVKDDTGTAVTVNCPETGSYIYNWDLSYEDVYKVLGDSERYTDVQFQVKTPSGTVSDESDPLTPITIQSRIRNVTPSGSTTEVEVYADDEVYPSIFWDHYGYLPTVDIEYDTGTDNFGNSIVGSSSNAGAFYFWEVPNIIGNDVKVRVMSSANSTTIYCDSAASFNVKGQIKIESPAPVTDPPSPTTVWTVHRADISSPLFNSTQNIKWRCFGTLNEGNGVNVQFSSTGLEVDFANVANGAGVVSGSGALAILQWDVPDNITQDNKIRIVDPDVVNTPADTETSAKFTIKGKLAIIRPAGGEPHYVDTADSVIWKYSGDIGPIKITLDDQGGAGGYDTQEITASTAHNTGESVPLDYECDIGWTTPLISGNSYSIKIEPLDLEKADAVTTDGTNFPILGTITLIEPGMVNGSPETWTVEDASMSSRTINWSASSGIDVVDIYLDTDTSDGISQERTIILGYDSATDGKPYDEWLIPNLATKIAVTSDNCGIRIEDTNDITGLVFDESDYYFMIKPVIVPGALSGTPWQLGESPTINWTTEGAITSMRLYYATDGSTFSYLEIDNISASDGVVGIQWYINPTGYDKVTAGAVGKLKLVRINGVGEDADVLLGPFEVDGRLNWVSPTLSTAFNASGTGTIKWSVDGTVGKVKIMYSTDTVDPPYEDNTFTNFIVGDIDADWCEVNEIEFPLGYDFTVPPFVEPSIKIRVMDQNENEVYCVSPTVCSIKGNITLDDATTQGKDLTVGQTNYYISWTPTGTFTGYKVFRKRVGVDADFELLSDTVPNTATTYQWIPSDTDICNDVLFRVEDVADPSVGDENELADTNNTVKGSLTLTYPKSDSSITYTMGVPGDIRWIRQGNIGTLKFELNITPGAEVEQDWITLNTNLPQTFTPQQASGVQETYTWTIPDMTTVNGRIRVTSSAGAADGTALPPDQTLDAQRFKIKPVFGAITAPTGDTVWYVGDDPLIQWNNTGTMESVDIAIQIDGGLFQTIVSGYDNEGAGLDPASNSYTWVYAGTGVDPLQNQISENCYIKITDTMHGFSVTSGSGSDPFTFIPRISVDNYAGTAIAETTLKNVSWSYEGNKLGNVEILVDPNGDGTLDDATSLEPAGIIRDASPLAATSALLPDTLTPNAKIVVRDFSKPYAVSDITSQSTFVITGELTINPSDTVWEV
ncbi:MAG: hypothetical protein KAI72_10700, partial [Candidatus Pacebacteria bacterium]|nr:hypothetical protein [Candidatus Paceibacterota bacterium]